jgi:hypothetical protein
MRISKFNFHVSSTIVLLARQEFITSFYIKHMNIYNNLAKTVNFFL